MTDVSTTSHNIDKKSDVTKEQPQYLTLSLFAYCYQNRKQKLKIMYLLDLFEKEFGSVPSIPLSKLAPVALCITA